MYQRKLERNALIGFAICLVLFLASVANMLSAPSRSSGLVLLSTFVNTVTFGILWRDRRRARQAAELRPPLAMPVPTERSAGVAR